MIGSKGKITVFFVSLFLFLHFGCKNKNIQKLESVKGGISDIILAEENPTLLVGNFSRYLNLRYTVISDASYISIILKQIKNDTLIFYALSKEEFYQIAYTGNEVKAKRKPTLYYPFGIRKYISKTTEVVGDEIFNFADSIFRSKLKSRSIKKESICSTENKYNITYLEDNKLASISSQDLDEKYLEEIFKKMTILFQDDSSALRLWNEKIDFSNN